MYEHAQIADRDHPNYLVYIYVIELGDHFFCPELNEYFENWQLNFFDTYYEDL